MTGRERGVMHWFGESWGAPMNADCPHHVTPIDVPCLRCQKPIADGDAGVLMVLGGIDHLQIEDRVGHIGEERVVARMVDYGITPVRTEIEVVMIDVIPYVPEHRDCFLEQIIGRR